MIKRSLFSAAILGALALAAVGFKGSIDSGIKVGEFVTAFHPNHLVGPHKGTDACPPCTYGKLPAVQFWVNGDDTSNVEAITKLLDHRVGNWEKSNFKAFVIFVTTPESKASTASITPLPMPRAGTLITRRRLTSSCGLMTRRM